jgi:hypothetical protein
MKMKLKGNAPEVNGLRYAGKGPCFAMTADIGLTEAGGVSMLVLLNKSRSQKAEARMGTIGIEIGIAIEIGKNTK